MSYTYFPKNGNQVNLFGIPVGRAGREFPFPVQDYETGVAIGVLVRSAEEMDNYKKPNVVQNTLNPVVDDDLMDDINAQAEAELLKVMSNMDANTEPKTEEVKEIENSEPKALPRLTREEAFKFIKMEADGTYAKHADGTYKIKGGWKPYSKEEIYKALAE